MLLSFSHFMLHTHHNFLFLKLQIFMVTASMIDEAHGFSPAVLPGSLHIILGPYRYRTVLASW